MFTTAATRTRWSISSRAGQIKLLLLSPEGKECLLAIHSGGDVFGELCLAGLARHETRDGDERNEAKTNTLLAVFCAAEP